MRVLILGGDGMLGHRVFEHLQARYTVRVTVRQPLAAYAAIGLFDAEHTYGGIDVRCADRLIEVMADFRPEAVVNAVGIVKQRPEAMDSIQSLEVNALLPHRLAVLCRAAGAHLVHVSTDCVFSGRKGNYLDDDPSDADDLYGKTKFLGEVRENACITLRTSIVGRELFRKSGLLEWFLRQRGTIKGFRRAIFSGLTTPELSRVIEHVLARFPGASGVYNVSGPAITKYELLLLLKTRFDVPVEVVPDDEVHVDRSLDSTRFRREFSYKPPSWEDMVDELARDRREGIQ